MHLATKCFITMTIQVPETQVTFADGSTDWPSGRRKTNPPLCKPIT